MARADWEPAEMHQLANDLRLLVKDIDGTKVSHIKQFADQLDMQATDMEEHRRTYLQNVQFVDDAPRLAIGARGLRGAARTRCA